MQQVSKTLQQKLNTTTTSQPKQQLSKNHLNTLFQTKKIKSAKQYISQLKNSNPRAQKAIKQSLNEIFSMKKVSSATAYMYALVFYKNLLISAEMDYYEDEEFFNVKIHQAIMEICQYNPQQKDIRQRGADYFSYALKLEQKENQDLQATGKAVVVFALELLQTMGELYKQSYLTGQESFFSQKYHEILAKGVTFPKKQEYLYIKQQDRKQFEQNYIKLLQEGQEQEHANNQNDKNSKQIKKNQIDKNQFKKVTIDSKKPQEKKSQNVQKNNFQSTNHKKVNNQSQPIIIKITKQLTNQPLKNQTYKKQAQNQQMQKIINNIINVKNQKQDKKLPSNQSYKIQQKPSLSVGVADILKQVQQKKKLQQFRKKQNHQKQKSSKNQQQKQTVHIEKFQQKKSQKPTTGQTISIVQKAKQQNISYIDQKQTSRKETNSSLKKMKTDQKQIYKEIPNNNNVKNQKKQQQIPIQFPLQNKVQKKISTFQSSLNNQKQISSLIRKSFKRTQILNSDKITPQKIINQINLKQINSLAIQSKSKEIIILKNHPKHKHRIFEQVKQKTPKINVAPQIQQKNQQNNPYFKQSIIQQELKVSDSIVSFSPNSTSIILNRIKPSPPKSQKKSVPKTQKKFIDKTFVNNFQQLASKLNSTQKSFGNINKKSFDKFPTKTLSAWRCQKFVKKQNETLPSQQQMLEQLWSTVKSKRIPFVPQYFHPTTLKMSALRRAALQLFQHTSSSQVFFNNGIISARLMKPSQNYFILSLANVSGKDLIIRVQDKKGKQNFQESIKFVDKNDKKKRLLKEGGFLDVRFVFVTNDFNFKLLTFNIEINEKILTLQLPVTLLDSCKIIKSVDMNDISSLIKRSSKKIISQQFKLNLQDIPKFLITNSESQNNRYGQNFKFTAIYFTVSISKSQNSEINEQIIIFCRINEVVNIKGLYQLSIIFDNNNEDTQNFAKVITELLVFLLCD